MRDLESASVLAVGPLSGLGARVRALGAIFNRSTVELALWVGGITAAVVAMAKISIGVVRAQKEFQSIEATLTVASGSVSIANREFDKIAVISRRLGIDLRTAAVGFAQLSASTKGTKLEGQATVKLFEDLAIASAALKLPAQGTERLIKAVQQSMSKMIVQAEELRGQLGDVLPGAFNLAAKAMGVTTVQLNKMLRDGKVLSEEFFPKFGQVIREELGGAATLAADSLQAALNNLSTATFQFNLALDEALGITDTYKASIVALTSVLDFLRTNMVQLIGIIGAASGALLGLFAPQIFSAVVALIGYIRTLTVAVLALNAAMLANPFGAVTGLLVRLGAAAIGAVTGYLALSAAADSVGATFEASTTDLKNFIAQQWQSVTATKSQIKAYVDLAEAEMVPITRALDLNKKKQQELQALFAKARESGESPGLAAARELTDLGIEAKDLNAKLKILQDNWQVLWDIFNRAPDTAGATLADAGDKAQGLADKIREMNNEMRGSISALTAGAIGGQGAFQAAIDNFEAMNMIVGASTEELVNAQAALIATGNSTGDLVTDLAALIANTRAATDATEAMKHSFEAAPQAIRDAQLEIEKVRMSVAAMAQGPQAFEQFERAQDIADRVRQFADALRAAGVEQKVLNDLVAQYAALLKLQDQSNERLKAQKQLSEDISGAISSSFADVGSQITELFVKGKGETIKWKNVVIGVLQDIALKLLQISLIKPLAEGIGNILGSVLGGLGGVAVGAAKGKVFRKGNVVPFRQGGLIKGPTVFPLSRGRTGMAGEAGEEAILPLKRGRGGRLGVEASGGGRNVTNIYADMRGASVEAVNRLAAWVASIDGNLERRAISGVFQAQRSGGRASAAFSQGV
jgi:tape measure domain-containing protein